MKPLAHQPIISRHLLATVFALAALIGSGQAPAADIFWSGNGSTLGGAGTWDTTNPRWGASAGPYTTIWDNTLNAGDLAQFSAPTGAVTIQAGGITTGGIKLNTAGYSFSGGTLSIGSQGIVGSATFGNPLSISANQAWSMVGNIQIEVSGPISGSANISLSGGGLNGPTLILSGNNSAYTGTISQGSAKLQLGNTNALGTGTLNISNADISAVGGSHSFANDIYRSVLNSDFVLSLTGSNGMEFAGTFTIDAGINRRYVGFNVTNSALTEFSGVIQQDSEDTQIRDIRKLGSGTLVFSGDNTYPGITHVHQGTLRVNGSPVTGDSYIVGGPTWVNPNNASDTIPTDAARLEGIGTINLASGATLEVLAGGTLAPGESVGTLNLTGTGNANLAGTLEIEIGGGVSDLLDASGAIALAGTLTVVDLGGNGRGVAFDVLRGASISGDFSVFNLPAGYFVVDNGNLDGTYTLGIIPEPTSLALLGLAGLAALHRRR